VGFAAVICGTQHKLSHSHASTVCNFNPGTFLSSCNSDIGFGYYVTRKTRDLTWGMFID